MSDRNLTPSSTERVSLADVVPGVVESGHRLTVEDWDAAAARSSPIAGIPMGRPPSRKGVRSCSPDSVVHTMQHTFIPCNTRNHRPDDGRLQGNVAGKG